MQRWAYYHPQYLQKEILLHTCAGITLICKKKLHLALVIQEIISTSDIPTQNTAPDSPSIARTKEGSVTYVHKDIDDSALDTAWIANAWVLVIISCGSALSLTKQGSMFYA